MPRTPDVVVLGGGPAGLGAAIALAGAGADAVVVEAGERPGGLCVTRRVNGFAYDLGGHIPFVRDEARRRWLEDLLGGDLHWVGRPVACVRDGRTVRGRYLDQRPEGAPGAAPAGERVSARDELGARFGAGFVDRTMRPYLEKIDGVPLERIPAERARRLLEDQAAPEGFWFPGGGIGRLMDAMTEEARRRGADVRLGTRVTSISAPGGRLRAVTVDGGGGPETLRAGQAVVSLPPGLAARMTEPGPPPDALGPVRMRAVCLVYLALGRERLTAEPWIQVDDPRVPFSRAFEPANWSPRMAPPGRTVVGLECYCAAETADPVWGLDDDALARACSEALADPLGWLDDPDAASPLEVLRLPRAYPVPDVAQIAAVRAPALWLGGVEGVHLAPGSAVLEAVEAGERAAAAILAGAPDAEVAPGGLPPIS